MVHGPGCPVCVLPVGRLDMAIELAMRPEVILCSYGDMLRIPGSRKRSLLRARAEGADVQFRGLALVLQVLRGLADRGERIDPGARADGGAAVDDDVAEEIGRAHV